MARTFCHQESPPLAGREPEARKTGRKILLSLIAPKTHIFHKQLFFRIIELLEPDLAEIPPHPIGSMRSWDNSLSIHAESWIFQSDLEFAMTDSFAHWWIMGGTIDSPPPFTGCDSYTPIRIIFSISWFPFHSQSSSSFPLHAETVFQHYDSGLSSERWYCCRPSVSTGSNISGCWNRFFRWARFHHPNSIRQDNGLFYKYWKKSPRCLLGKGKRLLQGRHL